MDIVDTIRSCPLARASKGLPAYPQPTVNLPGATSVTVDIFNLAATPVSNAATPTKLGTPGAGISGPGTTGGGGIQDEWSLDMGNAATTAIIDVQNTEGVHLWVVFTPNTGSAKAVRVVCNDALHVEQVLYPDRAVYCDDGSGFTGTGFPNGSVYQKASQVAQACTILTARGYNILDLSGCTFDGTTDVPTSGKVGNAIQGKTVRVMEGYEGVWFPNTAGDEINVTDTTFLGLGILNVATYGTAWHGGPCTYVGCNVKTLRQTGSAATGRWGEPVLKGGTLEGTLLIGDRTSGGGAAGCWAWALEGVLMKSNPLIDCTGWNGGGSAEVIEVTGSFHVDNATSHVIEAAGAIGSGDIVFDSQVIGCTLVTTGAYNAATDNGSGNTLIERQLAHTSGLIGNIVNLAPGSITATESPLLSTVAADAAAVLAALTANVINLAPGSITATESPLLSAVATDVLTVLARVGVDDMAILKGMLLGNYLLDGGPNAVDPTTPDYTAQGVMTVGRYRVFATAVERQAATRGAAAGADGEIGLVEVTAAAVTGKAWPAWVAGDRS